MFVDVNYIHINTINVKNMHPHRDSNPGPWNTVSIVMCSVLFILNKNVLL